MAITNAITASAVELKAIKKQINELGRLVSHSRGKEMLQGLQGPVTGFRFDCPLSTVSPKPFV